VTRLQFIPAELLLRARENDTFYGELFDVGWPNAPHRVLRNKTVDTWELAGRPRSGVRPGEGEVIASSPRDKVVRYQCATPAADFVGDIEALPLWAGQGVGLVSKTQPAAEIVQEIIHEAEEILNSLAHNDTA
jgi:NAD(P)H-dependent flavin oxidoreductase YrpB (nitropropane dioxygenase family)